MRSVLGLLLVTSAMLILPACGRATSQPAADTPSLAAFEPLPDRQCFAAEQPLRLPAADALLDSLALRSALGEASLSEGYAVFSLLYSPDGAVLHNQVIESNLAPDEQRRALQVLRTHLHERPRAGGGAERWGVQLKLMLAADPDMEVGRQEICPAVRVGGAQRMGVINAAAGRDGNQPYTDTDKVRLRIRVDEQGATTVRVVQGSRSGAFDAEAATIAGANRYLPMLIDRIPVATEFERSFP